jgi:hypothetical protein
MRLSSRVERWLYVLSATLLLSGVGWLASHYFFTDTGFVAAFEFEGAPHPLETWWLRLHGAGVMGFLVALGAVLPRHVVHGWRRRWNHRSGLIMLSLVAALALSGYALYYLSNEQARPWISVVHWLIGLATAGAMIVHVFIGKREAWRRNLRASRTGA